MLARTGEESEGGSWPVSGTCSQAALPHEGLKVWFLEMLDNVGSQYPEVSHSLLCPSAFCHEIAVVRCLPNLKREFEACGTPRYQCMYHHCHPTFRHIPPFH
jgi:hypothetical protein